MSITEQETTGVLHREFAAELTVADGRTVDTRVIPYGETITHNDGLGGVAKGVTYEETWAHGSFTHQLNAANRVVANYEHQQGIGGIVGHGLALREEQDGLYGSFKIHATAAGDTALELIRDGVLASVSLEAIPRKATKTANGITRTKADLVGVAFTRFGAYSGAQVLAVREAPEHVMDEMLLPIEIDPDLVERCRQLGIEIPQRYKAHPETSDTPDEGTSENGTRPSRNLTTQDGVT
jgi:hypothetical protein